MKRNKNTRGEQLYCPDAVCIFHVNSNDDLVPIAIQLVPDDSDTIFTPNDSELDWLLAKMYYNVAFCCLHQVIIMIIIIAYSHSEKRLLQKI